MVPELGKPKVTEIQVRMDCNGCVQKIKKALHGINGIYDLYIDFPQQKLTVIGWADPEKIVKAIRKTRKIATICSHTEPSDQPPDQPTEPLQQPTEGAAPPPAAESANPPAAEAPTPPAEAEAGNPPPAETQKDPPPPENTPPEEKPSPSPPAAEINANQPPGPKDVGEVHVMYHLPPDYGYRYGYGHYYGGQWNTYPYPAAREIPPKPSQPQPIYMAHGYNTYRTPPPVEYETIQPPPQHITYSRVDHYGEYYHGNSGNGNITSIFSDENPNACTIV